MANQGLKTYITGLTGYLIIRYAEAATPTAYLGQTAPRAFPVDYTYDILNLRRVVHRFEYWQSNDGISLNQLIKPWDIDVAKQELPVIENYYYSVDGPAPTDPASGQLQLRDARLKDKPYIVLEKGTGHLIPGIDYIDRSDAGGGFDRTAGYEFQNPAWYLVIVQDKIVVDNSETVTTGSAGITDLIIASEDNHTLDSTWYNKLILARYATGGTGILQVPALASIPDGTHLLFSTHGNTSRYLKIQFNGSETLLQFHGKDRNWIYLGRNESLELLIKGGAAYVLDDRTGYALVGQRIYGDVIDINTVLADGAIYPMSYAGRLIDWVMDNFTSGQLLDFTTWGSLIFSDGVEVYPYRRFYAWDAASQQLHVPDSRDVYKRAMAVTSTLEAGYRMPGSYVHDAAKVDVTIWTGQGASDSGTINTGIGYRGGPPSETEFKKKNIIGTGETRPRSELLLPLIRI